MTTLAFGKYQVVQKIGAGGFGEVYEGLDPMLNRRVAIKTCSSNDEELRQRFAREAEIAANLRHPNIVTIFDFGHQDGTPYLVQEYLSGEDLDHKIKRREALDEATIRGILEQIASGLEYAHAREVVHRDIKPANIRILDDGQVRIMDFGIAKLLTAQTQLTRTGMAMGTAAYLPPEQIMGKKVDQRADLFSFGVLAYELITLERPFSGDSMSTILYAIAHNQPAPVVARCPRCSPRLAALIETCLAKNPEERFPSFTEVIAELKSLAAVTTILPAAAAPAASPPPLPPPLPSAAPAAPAAPQGTVAAQNLADRTPATSSPASSGVPKKVVIGLLAAAVLVALGLGAVLLGLRGGSGDAPATGDSATTITVDQDTTSRDASTREAEADPSPNPVLADDPTAVPDSAAAAPDQTAALEAASAPSPSRPRQDSRPRAESPRPSTTRPAPKTAPPKPEPELESFPEPAPAADPAPVTPLPLIASMSAGLELGRLAPGQQVYADRPFVYESVPDAYLDLTCIRTRNDFKSIETSFDLELSRDADLFVAHDERIKRKPAWLDGFRRTGDRLTVNEGGEEQNVVGYEIFVKELPNGRVTLGANKPPKAKKKRVSMYVAFVRSYE